MSSSQHPQFEINKILGFVNLLLNAFSSESFASKPTICMTGSPITLLNAVPSWSIGNEHTKASGQRADGVQPLWCREPLDNLHVLDHLICQSPLPSNSSRVLGSSFPVILLEMASGSMLSHLHQRLEPGHKTDGILFKCPLL